MQKISFVYVLITLIFLIDLIASFIVFPLKSIVQKKKLLLVEIGLQILSGIALVAEFVPGYLENTDGVTIFQAVLYLRCF